MKRIVVGVTGATGAPLAVRILNFLRDMEVEVHLVVSQWARATLLQECNMSVRDLHEYADVLHDARDQGASISSGSFHTDGMIIVPCSMKTLAAIRVGYADNLIARAADVTLKERRKLIVVARETPLSSIHLENMLHLSNLGAVIFPPTPAFYNNPANLDEMLDHLAVRILDQFHLDHPAAKRWAGMKQVSHQE
ncbi:UbiX family flavin prenyltransferase [Paraburkholderia bannensis]|uniref:UbiX family flavin prenyltransferase n=1 Tax=Paraburkholderia bannensis TaxID=765414 RepID=UPI002AB7AA72|nr:UbiX family flavin prenyltransferase [Paraburkholderia bannensis]